MAEPRIETVAAKDLEGFCVDDAFVEAVENRVGMAAHGWDMVAPELICAEVVAEFLNRYKLVKQ